MGTPSYFLHDGSTQTGPFSLAELAQQPLTGQTMVWQPGMPDWMPLAQVPELSHLLRAAAPPPFVPRAGQPVAHTAPVRQVGKATWIVISIVAAVLLVSGLIVYSSQKSELRASPESGWNADAQPDAEQARLDQARQDAEYARDVKRQVATEVLSYVTAKATYESNRFFGGISKVHVTVTNTSAYTVDEALVELEYIKKNGEVYETEMVTAYNIFPRASVSVAGAGCSRGVTMRCTVKHARLQ